MTRKAREKRTLKTNPTKRRCKNIKRIVRERTSPICQNLNGIIAKKRVNFAQDSLKPRKNTNLVRKNEQNSKFAELMDLCDNSVCKECAMICTDAYSDEEYKEMVVYGDQGITSKIFDEETYGDFMNTDSN